jgi:hypothetical protein
MSLGDMTFVARLASEFGAVGLAVLAAVLLYRLVDKWAERFLGVQREQSAAMSEQAAAISGLANVVREGQTDQREVLIAVRVMSDRIERHGKYLETIDTAIGTNGGER